MNDSVVLPDELLDRYFNLAESDTTDSGSEAEAQDDDSLSEDELDTPLEDSSEDEDDTEGDDSGDEPSSDDDDEDSDAEAEPEDSDEDDAEDEDTEDEDESFLPPFDRKKFLKEHPELEPAYKHFQAAFTRKMQEVSTVQREVETYKQQYTEFVETLQSEDGAEDFLVQLALARPEVFERAADKVLALSEDEGEKKAYLREKELTEREKRIQREEAQREEAAQQARAEQLIDLTNQTGKALGLSSESELRVAQQYVALQIHENRARTGTATITDEEVKVAVKRAAKDLLAERETARKQAEAAARAKQLEATKAKARAAKRNPTPPKSKAGGKAPPPPPTQPGGSRLDSLIDNLLG